MPKRFEDPAKPFEGTEPPRRHGHIGQGPKPGPKRAVNLSVDADLLRVAKEIGINLSQTLEDALRTRTQDERNRRWQEENRDTVESYNSLIERAGVFGEELLDLDDPPV
jgi:antitoxin CcdA